jgi:hypothetical protein
VLTGKEVFVVVKFTSGEQVLSALQEEDDNYVELLHPMVVKTIPNIATGKEHVTAAPFCQFTRDDSYLIEKKNVMFIKAMHSAFVPHYMRIVEEHNDISLAQEPDEETKKKIEQLVEIFGDALEDETQPDEGDGEGIYVEGNDTRH